jgi:hypothetical protein
MKRTIPALCVVLAATIFALTGCHMTEPELPAKGFFFPDSLYGADLARISDQSDGYSGHGIQNEYARADAWNADGTRLVLRGNDGVHYLYNGTTYALERSLADIGSMQEMEPRWHETDPDVFYYFLGSQLRNYDLAADSSTLVHDFSVEFPGCGNITTGVEGDASGDRRLWCLMIADSAFGLLAVCTYDMTLDSIPGSLTSFPDAVNHVTMDATGDRAVIGWDSRPFVSYASDFSDPVEMPAGAMGHADIALSAAGRDVIVYQNVSTDYIEMADLLTGAATQLLELPFSTNLDIGMHISGNCYATPGWVLISTYGAENPSPGGSHSWMDNLLFMLELKSAPRILKLCGTNCYTGTNPRPNYFAEAFASINRAGTKAVVGSNWGRLSPEDYTDAYEVRLPTGWYQK